MVRIVKDGDDHICLDCDGRNWCYCSDVESDPICICGELGYCCKCNCDDEPETYEEELAGRLEQEKRYIQKLEDEVRYLRTKYKDRSPAPK